MTPVRNRSTSEQKPLPKPLATTVASVTDEVIALEYAPDGRLVDLLDGTHLEDRPEERVRQQYLRVLHLEFGYPKNVMRREVVIRSGANPALDVDGNPIRADIVIYLTPEAQASLDQGKINFVVECKRPNVESGYNQLVSYVFNTSAAGGVWTNGGDDVQIFRRFSAPHNSLEVAPVLPRYGEKWESVARLRRDELQRPRDVRRLLRLCHNKLHGRGIDGEEEDLAMDMVRIILAKAEDEIGTSDYPEFYVTEDEYRSKEGRIEVAARVQRLFRLFADDNPGVFSEHEMISVSPAAVTEVVAVLQRWAIMTRLEDADEWDIMGSAYEQYTATHLKRQRGQFFTNRLLIEFMVSALDPGPDVKALDPAGGSGGFLTAVLRHVRRRVIGETTNLSARREHQLANMRQRLFMVEVSPRLVKIAKTAMLLNGDGHSGMTKGNSLGPYDDLDDWIRARCNRHTPTLIITNPPFAGQGEGQITDTEILIQYQVAHKWTDAESGYAMTSQITDGGCPPEMLFFERCLDWLAPGGLMGIVMPKSFLDTVTYRAARNILFRDAQLLGVLNCHKNTFQPHTGVRTCVVFLRKYRESDKPLKDYQIFMAISRKIGQDSEGRPVFKLDVGGDTTGEIDADLQEILADFHAARNGTLVPSSYSFTVKRSELEDPLNINPQRYLPHLNESLRRVQEMDGRNGWSVTSLSQIEQDIRIYKGPRLRTENLLVEGPGGEKVEPYFTPSAVLQDRRDSIKWLDLSRATKKQLKAFDEVRVHRGDILITRSGSIGRLAYVTPVLDNAIVSDDAIRVRIKNPLLRAYVYSYLDTPAAQNQLLRNEYGAVQQHLEAHHVSDLLIPIPEDWSQVQHVTEAASEYIQRREDVEQDGTIVRTAWESLLDQMSDDGLSED